MPEDRLSQNFGILRRENQQRAQLQPQPIPQSPPGGFGMFHEGRAQQASGLPELLSVMALSRNQLTEVATFAQAFGEDTTVIQMIAKKLINAQMGQLKQLIMQEGLPPAATQVTPNIPAPTVQQ